MNIEELRLTDEEIQEAVRVFGNFPSWDLIPPLAPERAIAEAQLRKVAAWLRGQQPAKQQVEAVEDPESYYEGWTDCYESLLAALEGATPAPQKEGV